MKTNRPHWMFYLYALVNNNIALKKGINVNNIFSFLIIVVMMFILSSSVYSMQADSKIIDCQVIDKNAAHIMFEKSVAKKNVDESETVLNSLIEAICFGVQNEKLPEFIKSQKHLPKNVSLLQKKIVEIKKRLKEATANINKFIRDLKNKGKNVSTKPITKKISKLQKDINDL